MYERIILLLIIVDANAVNWMAVQRNGPLPDLPANYCEVGKNYKYICNVCECIPPGVPRCGTLSCMGAPRREHGDAKDGCVVGTAFHDSCNICNCETGLHALCTKMRCFSNYK
ncbi:hypothetical protein PV327_003334 [Microctonus hyperodae]|uniref:Pacifastin domain-containing protein n=1 Tax=Microctonus hyperodae TaxID=165561 RepID=A0AA39G3U8_MICHY|nr:hypothetical protein PV327_003334 [Microctonus hyperodae]